MSSQTDSQNLSAEVEVDVQEPDCPSQHSNSSVEVIALNVLPSLGVGLSGQILTRGDLDQMRSSGVKINFTKPKKNPTPALTHKVMQNKISLKAKSPPPTNGVVIKEPSHNSGRPTTDEVLGKDKEKIVEPPPKAKLTSNKRKLLSFFEVGMRVCKPLWSTPCLSYPQHARHFSKFLTKHGKILPQQ
ncbi:hypothetical protein Fot_29076 [Forsythia ovata]|uniref:Uncharacterized protein n=1 Tax=Forsythia ovata TaxID=205694 RepID=A0ABD1TRM6_9LAMI